MSNLAREAAAYIHNVIYDCDDNAVIEILVANYINKLLVERQIEFIRKYVPYCLVNGEVKSKVEMIHNLRAEPEKEGKDE